MIVRILGEGQYDLDDHALDALNGRSQVVVYDNDKAFVFLNMLDFLICSSESLVDFFTMHLDISVPLL